VSSVSVVGARATDPTAIVEAARLDTHPLMVDVRSTAVDRRVARLPWINTVRTERRWPQSVRIIVTERVAVAQMTAGDGQWALTDAVGRVLDIGPEQPDLPVLAGIPPPGPPGAVVRAPEALTVARALPPELRSRVRQVAVVDDGIDLALSPRGTAHLGGIDRLGEKLTAVATVLTRIDSKNLSTLDVRVPEAPVVTRGP
jgi:cell division protein FtsQ